MLDDAVGQGASRFLVAGDLLARAPYPLEVMRRLDALDAHIIRGNVDQYQIDYARALESPPIKGHTAPYGVVRWTHAQIGLDGVRYLEALPESRVVEFPGLPPLRLVHGSPASMNKGLVPPRSHPAYPVFRRAALLPFGIPLGVPGLAHLLRGVEESLLICGHTHIPWQIKWRHILVLNPGSVGLPLNGDPRAQYALLEWHSGAWRSEFRAVAYDWAALKDAYVERGLLDTGDPFARACLATALSGKNVTAFLYRHALIMLGMRPIGIEQLNRAAITFDWARFERPSFP